MRFYLASGLGNAGARNELAHALEKHGWTQTYDWTSHGSVQEDGRKVWEQVAANELGGVLGAQVVIALLPGGRGTHGELVAGIASATLSRVHANGYRHVFLVARQDQLEDENGRTCVFYWHPRVRRILYEEWDVEALASRIVEKVR